MKRKKYIRKKNAEFSLLNQLTICFEIIQGPCFIWPCYKTAVHEGAEDSTSKPNSTVRNELALITQQFTVTQPREWPWEWSCHPNNRHFLSGHVQVLLLFHWGCKYLHMFIRFFFSEGQINKDSALLPWGKSSVTSSTFLIHGWTQLICYTAFLINGLLRQATRTNGSIWISHRQALRLKQQPLHCPSSAPAIPQGSA